jgi:hypothetical protein
MTPERGSHLEVTTRLALVSDTGTAPGMGLASDPCRRRVRPGGGYRENDEVSVSPGHVPADMVPIGSRNS